MRYQLSVQICAEFDDEAAPRRIMKSILNNRELNNAAIIHELGLDVQEQDNDE